MSTRERLLDDLAHDVESVWYAVPLVVVAVAVTLVLGAPLLVVLLATLLAIGAWRAIVLAARRRRTDR